ncbi:MAG: archease [Candidatus Rokubacteria bacterium]|nr:archease [Candidatus Rokubacteria bacterium]
MGRFEFVDDIAIADAAVDIEATDAADLLETAAAALADLMVDTATVSATVERECTLAAPRLDLLLYDWLSELIYRKDRDQEVFTRARVALEGTGPWLLRARLTGGRIDPPRTALRADAKAVTFHQFRVERVDDGWRARVVIDI